MKLQVFIILVQTSLFANCLPCTLEWQPGSLGSVPDDAIESGPGGYIARVFVDNWYSTSLYPELGKVTLKIVGREFSYETYEVLTNPYNCVVRWDSTSKYLPIPRPDGAVATTIGGQNYVGRGKINGSTIAGTITEKGLSITYAGEEKILYKYEILASVYPKLHGTFSIEDFSDGDSRAVYDASYQHLVGSSLIEVPAEVSWSDIETITHTKTLEENFTLLDTEHEWSGISSLEVFFYLPFGTTDVKASVQLEGRKSLRITRRRELRFSKSITTPTTRNIQICTVYLAPGPNTGIRFYGVAELTADGMNIEQLKTILASTGRTLLDAYPERNSVTTVISGTLLGRYAVDLSSIVYPLDSTDNKAGKCIRDLHGQKRRA